MTLKVNEIRLNDREQIQYLLGNPPSWMMRYGISVMAGFFVLLLALSYFIRYPDVVEAKITLTTIHPPIRVMAQVGGRITDLLVHEHQRVEQGMVLAVLENPADWHDVLRLEDWLRGYDGRQDALLPRLQLGSLQSAYSTFSQHWKDYQYFTDSRHTAERILAIQEQIKQLEKMNGSLARQKAIFTEEFALGTQERNRKKQLHAENVISDAEFEKSEAAWLQQKRQIESAEAATLQNQMQMQQLQSQMNELRLTKTDDQNVKELTLAEDLQRLRSAIAEWKQSFLIIAPIEGEVSLSKIWSAQQSIGAGEEMLALIPEGTQEDASKIIVKACVLSPNTGKIKPDNRAIIRMDAYPAQQYGSIEGIIRNISSLPQQDEYLIDVELPNHLLTSYGKVIPFRQEMTGQLRIITEERRVIERIFDRLKDLLKNT